MKHLETVETEIAHEDLDNLIHYAREIAKLHVKYIKKGTKLVQIAATFGRIYFDQLKLHLDDEAMKIVNRDLIATRINGDDRHNDRNAITAHVCLRMSSALLSTVCSMVKANNDTR